MSNNIRYVLVDAEDNTYNILNKNFKRLEDDSTIEVDTIKKSFRAGSDFPGIQRDEAKEIVFQYDIFDPVESEFRRKENEFREFLRKTILIKDTVRQIQTTVLLTNHAIAYDEGNFLHSSRNTITLEQLIPFWEDIEEQVYRESGSSIGVISINNNGYVDTPPIITITALEQNRKFTVYINETREGILIEDDQFGINALNTYIIDCIDGTAELNSLDRRKKIKPTTGFFQLKVGINTVIFNFVGESEIEIRFRRRYYL
jgi:hypothetical protein